MVVTSGYYILKKEREKENIMNNVINDKYNKKDIFLCFKNYTLLGGSSHCTLHTSYIQKNQNILRLFTKYHSLQLYNTAMQVCIPLMENVSLSHTRMQHRYSQVISSRRKGSHNLSPDQTFWDCLNSFL